MGGPRNSSGAPHPLLLFPSTPKSDINIASGPGAEDLLGTILQPSDDAAAEEPATPAVFERQRSVEDEEALRQGDFDFHAASPEVRLRQRL